MHGCTVYLLLIFCVPLIIPLGLGHNSLTALPTEMGKLVKMTAMRLDYNYLTAIPSAFTSLTSLEYNKMDNREDWWSMAHNNFLNCTEAMKSLPSGLSKEWCDQSTQFCLSVFITTSMKSLCPSVLCTNKLRRCPCVHN